MDSVNEYLQESLYLFGGDAGGSIVNELWKFNVNTRQWTNLTLTGTSLNAGNLQRPLGVAGHTANLVNGNSMVVLFGYSRSGGYSTKVQEYNIGKG